MAHPLYLCILCFRDGGNGRNGDLRSPHSIVATVATVALYSVTATAGSSTTM